MTPQDRANCVKGVQIVLRDYGLYTGKIDGDPGPLTKAAWTALLADGIEAPEPPAIVKPPTPATPANTEQPSTVDARSEANIATLHPMVQQPFRDLLNAINKAVAEFGVTGKWIQGYRNEQQQNAEVAAGFSHAPWPYSAHNGGGGVVGFACDLGWFDTNGRYVEKEAATAIAVKISRSMGFHPGADFGDYDHHCKRPPSMDAMGENEFIREMIRRHENGIPLWP